MTNTRFIVTNLDMDDDPQGLYDGLYCERGEMENRIKDQQLGLFADRASSGDFHANQLRLLLSGLAHVIIEGMRRTALNATDLARASPPPPKRRGRPASSVKPPMPDLEPTAKTGEF